jgi:hypothetical protein
VPQPFSPKKSVEEWGFIEKEKLLITGGRLGSFGL